MTCTLYKYLVRVQTICVRQSSLLPEAFCSGPLSASTSLFIVHCVTEYTAYITILFTVRFTFGIRSACNASRDADGASSRSSPWSEMRGSLVAAAGLLSL